MTDIEQILANEVENDKTPSVQYFLFNQDSILKSVQLGFANISKQKPISTNTTYNAFSVTKTFTALAILQLAEQGKIDINKPVVQYLPEFRYGTEITVKHLLNHTAGIPNPIPLAWIHLDFEESVFDRNKFFQPIFEKNNKVKSKPNEKFTYSNLGYVILGQLIEKVANTTYEEYISQNIIRKLPINPNDLAFTIANKETHATGYHKKLSFSNLLLGFFIDKTKFMEGAEGKWRPFKKFYANGTSYGGLIGTPLAFIAYIQELMKDNSALISDKYKQMLFEENKNCNGKNTAMCLSWFVGELNGRKYFAHAGGGGGYYCEIRIYPDIKTGSVIFFNRTGITDERYLDKLDNFYINANR
ncbi:beta-lactamase [Flavobacterium enshiense DK69]|uniref:Beta-lactamase-related domain-containing protein n=1 Tax=Flavobacterium enshiense DK69 TaxID=1107311 RepID=V6SDS6_9FLAO|nr:serine hydrolase domain-containing protein [Flavobacterium enshiense]ESU24833.1 beta-lactamase [Flavobacterium enshiense DK69]KGO96713.1 hypothetical protein Q767_03120 [Flavobacterium enshiense DK69]